MTSKLISFATLVMLLATDSLAGIACTVAADPARGSSVPALDIAAPQLSESPERGGRAGGEATRIELDDAGRSAGLSAWYRLAYVEGDSRLRVFEHYSATTRPATSDIVESENAAWRLANQTAAPAGSASASNRLPRSAWFRTGNDTGPSAGLMFTLAYIDLLTPGRLVGNLRVAGTGAIGRDGVVAPVSNVDVKVAAALLARPDVVFTPTASNSIEHTTIIESHHTRLPADGYTVAEWLNTQGYEQAGRDAARHPGTAAFVVVHDFRQALAFLCGRTQNTGTCSAAQRAATIPIGTP